MTNSSANTINCQYPQNKLSDRLWVFRFGRDKEIVEKIASNPVCQELGNSTLVNGVSEGVVTGKNSVLLVKEEDVKKFGFEPNYIRKCVRGEDIKRYSVHWGKFYLIYPYHLRNSQMEVVPEEVLQKTSPRLYAYLKDRKGELESRTYLAKTKKRWYEIWCPRDYRLQDCSKIVVPELADRSQFALVPPEFFYVDTTCGIALSENSPLDLWYTLAILNSRAGEYLYSKTTVPKANGFLIYKTMFLNTFLLTVAQVDYDIGKLAPAFTG